ncbi:thioredoxin domain-containing protein 5 homolog [Ornithodoros turicata]|uniref:thioredoxin domain-containing protein 5 homolog n=1 Tax=Ornithodoros turicata TaxID=34597 RepID=UPI003138CCE0
MARTVLTLCVLILGNCYFVICTDLYKDNAVKYDETAFKKAIGKVPHFVKFFAPWCGHCKRLAPTWDELAEKYNEIDDGTKVIISKVDCTTESQLCAEQDITGYPTLKFFKASADEGIKYRGPRDLASLEAFISENLGEAKPDVVKEDQAPAPSVESLAELTDATFHKAVETGQHFVKFYAPWCGHCQKLAPVWEALAATFEHDPSLTVAKVDCTANRQVCNDFEVKAYPTLLWIEDGKMVERYQGGRSHEELKEYCDRMRKQAEEAHSSQGDGSSEDVKDHPQSLAVELSDKNFDNAISQGVTFVKFFAPWCGHCKRLAPTWEELSRKFATTPGVKVAKVDCTAYEELCNAKDVQGYPTLILYKSGRRVAEFNGARELDVLYEFVEQHMAHDEL